MVGELVADYEVENKPMPEDTTTPGVVSEIRSGKRKINLRQAKVLAERFRLPIETFVD